MRAILLSVRWLSSYPPAMNQQQIHSIPDVACKRGPPNKPCGARAKWQLVEHYTKQENVAYVRSSLSRVLTLTSRSALNTRKSSACC